MDRVDIHIGVPRLDDQKLSSDRVGESSELIRQQRERFDRIKDSSVPANADMRVGEIRQFWRQDEESQCLMSAAMSQLNDGMMV